MTNTKMTPEQKFKFESFKPKSKKLQNSAFEYKKNFFEKMKRRINFES